MKLEPFDVEIFIFNPGKLSNAAQGRCSVCFMRTAIFMLSGPETRHRRALCRLHARLWQLNQGRNEVRELIRSGYVDVDAPPEIALVS